MFYDYNKEQGKSYNYIVLICIDHYSSGESSGETTDGSTVTAMPTSIPPGLHFVILSYTMYNYLHLLLMLVFMLHNT